MPKRKHKDISKDELTLQSRVKLNSGYEMPVVGFGVSHPSCGCSMRFEMPPCLPQAITGLEHVGTAPSFYPVWPSSLIRGHAARRHRLSRLVSLPWRLVIVWYSMLPMW